MRKTLFIFAALLAMHCGKRPLYAACASGFISIVDAFQLPNSQPWTGSIVYTLAYNTTVAGATIVNARQQFNVTNGISICLAPGIYTPVTLNQSGFNYGITQSWGVPNSGGPYTIAQIQGIINLNSGLAPAGLLSYGTFYSAAGTPLPACNSSEKGVAAVVLDATTPTFLAAYTSGGAVFAPVICTGSTWVTY
jgi:hypothetical protein